jgi:hypothetical protein
MLYDFQIKKSDVGKTRNTLVNIGNAYKILIGKLTVWYHSG